jgi:hypothetical protein
VQVFGVDKIELKWRRPGDRMNLDITHLANMIDGLENHNAAQCSKEIQGRRDADPIL